MLEENEYLDNRPGMVGYLMKYPAEGSNTLGGGKLNWSEDILRYPTKCKICKKAWVSSAVNMRKHIQTCSMNSNLMSKNSDNDEDKVRLEQFGTPRRYWFEIDYELNQLKWKTYQTIDMSEEGDDPLSVVDLSNILNVESIDSKTFMISNKSRKIILQAQNEQEKKSWMNSLEEIVFVSGRPPGAVDAEELIQAIAKGNVDRMKEILHKDTIDIDTTDEHLNNFLLVACKAGAGLGVISVLLENGINCNIINTSGETALMIMCASGEFDIVHQLLKARDIDINLKCINGLTALHAAASNGESRILSLLYEAGGDIFEKDDRGWTILHHASMYKNGIDVVNLCCDIASELINETDSMGNTALHLATQRGYFDIIKALLQTAASLNIFNYKGQLPIDIACEKNEDKIVLLLEEYMPQDDAYHEKMEMMIPEEENLWEKMYSDDGHAYYYNHRSGESQWESPDTYQTLKQICTTNIDDSYQYPIVSTYPPLDVSSFDEKSIQPTTLSHFEMNCLITPASPLSLSPRKNANDFKSPTCEKNNIDITIYSHHNELHAPVVSFAEENSPPSPLPSFPPSYELSTSNYLFESISPLHALDKPEKNAKLLKERKEAREKRRKTKKSTPRYVMNN